MAADRRKLLLLGVVYATQGLAPGFTSFAVPVLLRREGLSLAAVGLSGLLFWPWAVKLVWGPLTDRIARAGRGRLWIAGLQLLLAALLSLVALARPGDRLGWFIGLLAAVNLVASVLDVATDGLAVRVLTPAERAPGNAAQYGGYYLGSILAGGAFLAVEPRVGWGPAVAMLTTLVAGGLGAALLLGAGAVERPGQGRKGRRRWEASSGLRGFLAGRRALFILPLILLLDLPQNFGVALVGPFLLDAGLTQQQVGMVSGTAGLAAALAGAVAGALVIGRMARARALVVFCVLQAVPLLALAGLASTAPPVTVLVAGGVVSAAYFLASAFNVALSSWFMDWAAPSRAATDYSIMACAHNATYVVAEPFAGVSAGALGFPAHFGAAALGALVLVVPAWLLLKRMSAALGSG